jgi:genome maintenance exonuclease 1
MPSVTTILSVTATDEKKESLARWRAKVGAAEADRITNAATKRGGQMHEHLEAFLKSQLNLDLLGHNTRERMMADVIIENGLKDQLSEIWGVEAVMYNPKLLYAGACDLVGIWNQKSCIIDFKSSTNLKKEEYIADYFLQGAAYVMAHNEVYQTNISQVAILICTKDNLFQKFTIEGEKLKHYEKEFSNRVEQYYELKKHG